MSFPAMRLIPLLFFFTACTIEINDPTFSDENSDGLVATAESDGTSGLADSTGDSTGSSGEQPSGATLWIFSEEMACSDSEIYQAAALEVCYLTDGGCDPFAQKNTYFGAQQRCGLPVEVQIEEPGLYILESRRDDGLSYCFGPEALDSQYFDSRWIVEITQDAIDNAEVFEVEHTILRSVVFAGGGTCYETCYRNDYCKPPF